MPVLSVSDLTISFSGPPVIENAALHIETGERVCVLGRNGAGKSTLLKTIAGEYAPDFGTIAFPQGGGAASLPQAIPSGIGGSVGELLASGFGDEGAALLALQRNEGGAALDPERQWQMEAAIERTLKDLRLEPETRFQSLSGGLKRRALLGRAIVAEPALLILDEPTNHLDLDSILWLEDFLLNSSLTLLFVTHDRAFLKKLATRIVEIDLAQLRSFRCDYTTYLSRKEELLEIESRNRAAFEKKLSQEEAWLRKGIKARRTRNEGRVKELKRLRAERRSWRERSGQASFALQQQALSGNKVITAQQVSAAYGAKIALRPFDLQIMRGDRIGIIGPNGSGKTTLLKLLLGELAPASGSIEHGTKLQIVYFDQMRALLDEEKTVFDNVADGADTVLINGRRQHVISYLQDFLFTPEAARSSLKTLSGGERNRLLLARLFTQPANLIVLDEPTNDLDIETLDLLEERIMNFEGTLLIVSHDRDFLENTITSLIVLSADGTLYEHPGGYDDWQSKRDAKEAAKADAKPSRQTWKPKKPTFSNRDRKELEELPLRIESLDQEKAEVVALMADPTTYQGAPEAVSRLNQRLATIDRELEQCYQRWEELETLKGSLTDEA